MTSRACSTRAVLRGGRVEGCAPRPCLPVDTRSTDSVRRVRCARRGNGRCRQERRIERERVASPLDSQHVAKTNVTLTDTNSSSQWTSSRPRSANRSSHDARTSVTPALMITASNCPSVEVGPVAHLTSTFLKGARCCRAESAIPDRLPEPGPHPVTTLHAPRLQCSSRYRTQCEETDCRANVERIKPRRESRRLTLVQNRQASTPRPPCRTSVSGRHPASRCTDS